MPRIDIAMLLRVTKNKSTRLKALVKLTISARVVVYCGVLWYPNESEIASSFWV